MADLLGNDAAIRQHCNNDSAWFFINLEGSLSAGHWLLHHMLAGRAFGKLTTQIRKRNRTGRGGFHHPTSGFAAECQALLHNSHTRADCLRLFKVSPEDSSGDDRLSRAIAFDETIRWLARAFTAEVNKRLVLFIDEGSKALELHGMGKRWEDDAKKHFWSAVTHQETARQGGARLIVRHLGWSFDRDFDLRPSRQLARLVSRDLGLRPMNERQARYLCGW